MAVMTCASYLQSSITLWLWSCWAMLTSSCTCLTLISFSNVFFHPSFLGHYFACFLLCHDVPFIYKLECTGIFCTQSVQTTGSIIKVKWITCCSNFHSHVNYCMLLPLLILPSHNPPLWSYCWWHVNTHLSNKTPGCILQWLQKDTFMLEMWIHLCTVTVVFESLFSTWRHVR